MAGGARILGLMLLCLSAVIIAETKTEIPPRASVNYGYSTSPPKYANQLHSYPGNSHGQSGPGRQVTSAPGSPATTYSPFGPSGGNKLGEQTRAPQAHLYPSSVGESGSQNKPVKQTKAPQTHSYPSSVGGSGSGNQPVQQTRAPQTHSYPSSVGGLRSGNQPVQQTRAPQTHSYPSSVGGSGSGNQPVQQTRVPQTHSYPSSVGGSGSGNKPLNNSGTHVTHSYPPSGGGSGSGNKPPNQTVLTQRPGTAHPPYNVHVHIRNQQASAKPTNIDATNINYYKYKPPQRISYSRLERDHVYYPTYSGILPDYVYEYRASRSRYRKLITGLALYNFGMLSQNNQNSQSEQYAPSENEICKFGIRSDENSYEEVDIDCRLLTDFIWSEKNQVLPSLPELITRKEVVNALDPKFDGAPIQIRPSMRCYMKWGDSFTSARVKDVDCGLLQTYVDKSFNAATKTTMTFLVVVTSFVVLLLG